METTTKQQTWSSQQTAGHALHGQSVIYDEANGKDIAIVYDGDAHAKLIAAAPELAAELRDNILRWSSSGVTLKDLERVGWLLEKAGLRLEGCEL